MSTSYITVVTKCSVPTYHKSDHIKSDCNKFETPSNNNACIDLVIEFLRDGYYTCRMFSKLNTVERIGHLG